MNAPERVVRRFLTYMATVPPTADGCVLWPLSIGSHGYGQIGWSVDGKTVTVLAHRLAWEIVNGPIPADLTVDHTCRVRRCVNVAHLRLLSNIDNASDNASASRMRAKTHCPRGHAYTPDNLVANRKGHRNCLECQRIRQRRPENRERNRVRLAKRRQRLKASF